MNLPKVYEPSKYEADIYALWEKSQAFQPRKAGKSFSVVVPPPNANANLHIGFALTMTLQDIAIRYHRLKGESVLFVPGADHAGFETQAVYEKHLAKEGKSRFDFTMEELYKNIWEFVAKNRQGFEEQFRSLGGSVDWSRFAFTLDEKIVRRAYATFKKMWDEGLIYRGERLVNYCTFHRTGFADIEVEYKESKTPLYYMKYGPFTLATTRPETKFGDTAVAVNTNDKRYKEWIGKSITVEGVNGSFEVRVIADDMVNPEFGTGVVKITPAHSFDDWEASQRHNLAAVRVINHDGTMNHHAGRFEGMTVLEARQAVVEALKEKGLLVKVDENYTNRVGHCYKCGTIIEPMLMEQWFVDMQPLAKPAIRALEEGKITFYPEAKKDQLIMYLKNLRDWNISRQIAWGIPIPAFQNVNDSDDWIYDERVDQKIIEINGKTYRRDTDVFDTWFSSSSWPYATLGYPDSDDFKNHYPLSLMETGGEILYPWVSRMIMLGLYVTGDIPFKAVYIHGYVMAEDGSKMSKSLGNVINAPEVIEKYGADALRMGIVAGRAAAVNRGYDPRKVEDARNFANKLWNIARYIEAKAGAGSLKEKIEPRTGADHWILNQLRQTADGIAADLESYRFAEAYDRLYHFVWDDFADWYLEASKVQENIPLLAQTLQHVLTIAHPFAPFVTETIWQTLSWSDNDSLAATSKWPKVPASDKKKAQTFEGVKMLITETRAALKDIGTDGVSLQYREPLAATLEPNQNLIKRFTGLKSLAVTDQPYGQKVVGVPFDCWLAMDSSAVDRYQKRLNERSAELAKRVATLQGRMANDSYVNNAPKELVNETASQLDEAQKELNGIEEASSWFSSDHQKS
jgi:valyl-tRNA synthetase